MKKTLAMILAVVLTMLLCLPVMAAEITVTGAPGTKTLREAIRDAVEGDTIVIRPYTNNRLIVTENMYGLGTIKEGVTLLIPAGEALVLANAIGNPALDGINDQYVGPLTNNGTIIVEGILSFASNSMVAVPGGLTNNGTLDLSGGTFTFGTGTGGVWYDPANYPAGVGQIVNNGIIYLPDGGDNIISTYVDGNKPVVKGANPDPEPALTSLGGNAGITITRPDPLLPFLVNPESAQAKDLFDEGNILGGTGFNFGEHKYTTEPQEINSLNSLSMIYGYLDPFNEVFNVTCEISDFLLEDGTPIFNDFSLLMRRQSFFADREDYPVVGKASFELAKNDPVVVVSTNELGHALTNYNSLLKLEANTAAGIGAANATITWNIGVEVI